MKSWSSGFLRNVICYYFTVIGISYEMNRYIFKQILRGKLVGFQQKSVTISSFSKVQKSILENRLVIRDIFNVLKSSFSSISQHNFL